MTRTPAESPAAASSVPLPPAPTGPDKGLSGLARGGALSLAGSAVSAVTGILLVIAGTRSLPQDVAGIFFALTSVFLIAEGVSRLGTGTGLVWAISRSRALGTTPSV